jgi:hypothetical protein
MFPGYLQTRIEIGYSSIEDLKTGKQLISFWSYNCSSYSTSTKVRIRITEVQALVDNKLLNPLILQLIAIWFFLTSILGLVELGSLSKGKVNPYFENCCNYQQELVERVVEIKGGDLVRPSSPLTKAVGKSNSKSGRMSSSSSFPRRRLLQQNPRYLRGSQRAYQGLNGVTNPVEGNRPSKLTRFRVRKIYEADFEYENLKNKVNQFDTVEKKKLEADGIDKNGKFSKNQIKKITKQQVKNFKKTTYNTRLRRKSKLIRSTFTDTDNENKLFPFYSEEQFDRKVKHDFEILDKLGMNLTKFRDMTPIQRLNIRLKMVENLLGWPDTEIYKKVLFQYREPVIAILNRNLGDYSIENHLMILENQPLYANSEINPMITHYSLTDKQVEAFDQSANSTIVYTNIFGQNLTHRGYLLGTDKTIERIQSPRSMGAKDKNNPEISQKNDEF